MLLQLGNIKMEFKRCSTDYSVTNFFYFTVNADTATTGNIKGGGYGCSVGPITIQA